MRAFASVLFPSLQVWTNHAPMPLAAKLTSMAAHFTLATDLHELLQLADVVRYRLTSMCVYVCVCRHVCKSVCMLAMRFSAVAPFPGGHPFLNEPHWLLREVGMDIV